MALKDSDMDDSPRHAPIRMRMSYVTNRVDVQCHSIAPISVCSTCTHTDALVARRCGLPFRVGLRNRLRGPMGWPPDYFHNPFVCNLLCNRVHSGSRFPRTCDDACGQPLCV